MTKEEMIIHWMDIAAAVFKAEDAIKDEWLPKLQATKNASKITKEQMADAYIRAIATEILEHNGGISNERTTQNLGLLRYARRKH